MKLSKEQIDQIINALRPNCGEFKEVYLGQVQHVLENFSFNIPRDEVERKEKEWRAAAHRLYDNHKPPQLGNYDDSPVNLTTIYVKEEPKKIEKLKMGTCKKWDNGKDSAVMPTMYDVFDKINEIIDKMAENDEYNKIVDAHNAEVDKLSDSLE